MGWSKKSGVQKVGSSDGTVSVNGTQRFPDLSVKSGGIDPYVIFRQGENEVDEVKLRKDMSFDLYAALCGPVFGTTPPAFTEAHCNGYDWILWDKQADKDVLYFYAGETKQWQQETFDINAILGGRINQIFPHRANFVICPSFTRTVTDYDFIHYAPTVTFKKAITGKPAGYKSICAGDYTGDGYVFAYLFYDSFLKQNIAGMMIVGEDNLKVRKYVPYIGTRYKAHTEVVHVNAMKDIIYVAQFDGTSEMREWYLTNDGNMTLKKWGGGAQDTCERMIAGRKFSHIIESAADRMVIAYEGVGTDKGKHYVESYVKNPIKEIAPEKARVYDKQVYLYTGVDHYTVSCDKKTEIYDNSDTLVNTRATAAAPLCGLCASWYVDGHMLTYIGGIGVNCTEMHSAVMGYLNDELRPYQKRGSVSAVRVEVSGDTHIPDVSGITYILRQNGEKKYIGHTGAKGDAVVEDVANGVYEQQLDVRGELKNLGSITVMGDTLQPIQVAISVKWEEISGKPDFDVTYAKKAHKHEIVDVTGLQDALNTKGNLKTIQSGDTNTLEVGGTTSAATLTVRGTTTAESSKLVILDDTGSTSLNRVTQAYINPTSYEFTKIDKAYGEQYGTLVHAKHFEKYGGYLQQHIGMPFAGIRNNTIAWGKDLLSTSLDGLFYLGKNAKLYLHKTDTPGDILKTAEKLDYTYAASIFHADTTMDTIIGCLANAPYTVFKYSFATQSIIKSAGYPSKYPADACMYVEKLGQYLFWCGNVGSSFLVDNDLNIIKTYTKGAYAWKEPIIVGTKVYAIGGVDKNDSNIFHEHNLETDTERTLVLPKAVWNGRVLGISDTVFAVVLGAPHYTAYKSTEYIIGIIDVSGSSIVLSNVFKAVTPHDPDSRSPLVVTMDGGLYINGYNATAKNKVLMKICFLSGDTHGTYTVYGDVAGSKIGSLDYFKNGLNYTLPLYVGQKKVLTEATYEQLMRRLDAMDAEIKALRKDRRT